MPSTPQFEQRSPDRGYTGRTGPMGLSGESPIATASASSEPRTTAARTPISPSATVTAGPAPSARKRRGPRPPSPAAGNGLQAEDQTDEARDGPEHPERDRLGLERELHLLDDAWGRVELIGEADEVDQLPLYLGNAPVVIKLQPVEGGGDRVRAHRSLASRTSAGVREGEAKGLDQRRPGAPHCSA